MKQGYQRLWAKLMSAPVLVAAGMAALVIGGLGGVVLLAKDFQSMGIGQSGFGQGESIPYTMSSQALLREIDTLKSDIDGLLKREASLHAQGISFLGFSQGEHALKTDPFAAVALPKSTGTKSSEALITAQEAQKPPTRIVVPGDRGSQPQPVASHQKPSPDFQDISFDDSVKASDKSVSFADEVLERETQVLKKLDLL